MWTYYFLFIFALFLTIAIEGTAIFLLNKFWLKKFSLKEIIACALLTTPLTLPYLWFLFPYFLQTNSIEYIIFSESFAVLVETVIIAFLLKLCLKKSFTISFVANATSFLIGLIIMPILF